MDRGCAGQISMTGTALPFVTIEQVSIDELRPDPANPRRIGEDELDALTRSLRQFGFVQPILARSADRAKDQTYFLFGLDQAQLGLAMFPLGGMDKAATREVARRLGLPNAEKPESQEICFVPEGDYRAFLGRERPGWSRPGEIVDGEGNVLGAHAGVAGFTVGQRRGLRLAGGAPRYVVRLEAESATVVVGGREDLHRERFRVEGVRWTLPIEEEGRRLLVQVRHRQAPAPCLVRPLPGGMAGVEPGDPAALGAVAPGQAAVFYEGDLLCGGGWVAG